jgi:hypothetical protein
LNRNRDNQIFLLVYLDPLAKHAGVDWFIEGQSSTVKCFLEKRGGESKYEMLSLSLSYSGLEHTRIPFGFVIDSQPENAPSNDRPTTETLSHAVKNPSNPTYFASGLH